MPWSDDITVKKFHSVSKQGQTYTLLGERGQKLITMNMGDSKSSLTYAKSASTTRLALIAGYPIAINGNGHFRVGESGGWHSSSLGDRKDLYSMMGEGAVVLRERDARQGCRLTHFWMYPESPRSYKNSGIEIPCGRLNGASGDKSFGGLMGLFSEVIRARFVFAP